MVKIANKDVLLIECFDRVGTVNGWQRKIIISALTILELNEMMARYASYEKFAETIRIRFTAPKQTLKGLYSRMVFNILCGTMPEITRPFGSEKHSLSLLHMTFALKDAWVEEHPKR